MMRRRSLLLAFFLPLLLAACVNVQTRASREYMLSWHGEIPEDFERGAPTAPRGETIAIGPVVMPTYLQRTGIVTRLGDHRINASTEHSWGESLEAGVARLLVESVARDTDSNRVSRLPWPFPGYPELRVAVEVLNFEYERESGQVSLVARWTVLEGPRGLARLLRREIIELPLEDNDFESIVLGMSKAVLRMGREISNDILKLQASRGEGADDGAPGADGSEVDASGG